MYFDASGQMIAPSDTQSPTSILHTYTLILMTHETIPETTQSHYVLVQGTNPAITCSFLLRIFTRPIMFLTID